MNTGDGIGAPPESPEAARWEGIQALLHQALARPPRERASFLDAACPDPASRHELDTLLDAHARPGKLDTLARSVMAPLIPSAARPKRRAPAPPVLDRYPIIDHVGGGGMGVVYRARDERLGRDVALKFLPPHLSMDEAAKKRFMVEARAAASLEHPNICTVHEIGETDDGQLYIVMGYYEGETLDRRIARGPLPYDEALRIAEDVSRGLSKAHDRGIVHRDVKPANIMVTSDGIVKILDFGIAKLSDVAFTQTGGVVGTVAYMSPEQAFGEPVDGRTDIWALGVVLYEMLTGSRPFRAPNEQALLFAILKQDPEPIGSPGHSAIPEIEAILQRALAKRAQDRFSDARDLLGALSMARQRAQPERIAAPSMSQAQETAGTDTLLTRAGERRHGTVVVTGISGYAKLIELIAPEDLDRLATSVRDAAVEAATRHGGIVNYFAVEDTVLLFGVATSHEDDFVRAVRATLELHESVRALSVQAEQSLGASVRLHTGIHTGAVVAQRQRMGDRRFRIAGAPLDGAMRLAAAAAPDEILISPECHRLVAPFIDAAPATEAITLQPGAPAAVPFLVTRVSDSSSRLEATGEDELTPYSGRTRELEALGERIDEALAGSGGTSVIMGEPGSGKSRLLLELRHRMDGSPLDLAFGRCDAYGGTTPYLPFIQAMRGILGVDAAGGDEPHDEVVARVCALDEGLRELLPLYLALLSIRSTKYALPRHLQGEHLQAAMLEALSALFTSQARHRPTVLLLEDWHWADEASRSALEQLAEIAPAYPLLIIVTCRPDSGVEWRGREQVTLTHLTPLSESASTEIMRAVLGAATVRAELAAQLHERTGGNPFFLEETCQALREEGAIVIRNGEAVAASGTGSVHLPETVQAVIRTRLDRLDSEARDVLRVAAVVGREFARAVLDETAGPGLSAARPLDRLRASGLIQQVELLPEPIFRFKHVLTQEVAYDTLLEHQRKMLHAAAGRAMEKRYSERIDEHLERLTHHFSRAEEWRDAVRYGIRAADRAKSLSQFADALAMLDRVQTWLPMLDDSAERQDFRADTLLRQERVCETLGLRTRQIQIVEELIGLLAPQGGSTRLAEAYLRQGDVFTLLRRFDAADRSLGTALRLSRELGDRSGERNALRSIGLLRSHEGRPEEAITSIEHALALDVELGETTAAAGDVASLGNILRNMGRQAEALEALEQALEYLTEHDDPTKRCAVMVVLAMVHREMGDSSKALALLEEATDLAIERRLPILTSFSLPAIAHIQLEQGDVEKSLASYRRAVDLSRRARHADGLAQSLRASGEVLFGLSRFSEALPLLREASEVFANLEDAETQSLLWQRIATAHERSGEFEEAHAVWDALRDRCRGLGDSAGEALALEGIARCARHSGERPIAIAHYEEALARAVSAGNREREVTIRNTLGLLRWEDGMFGEALRQYEAALRLCRELDDRVHEGLILNSLGATLFRLRRYDEARTALEAAVEVNRRTAQQKLEAHSQAVLGQVLLALGRAREAREAFEASLAIRPEIGDRLGEGWMFEHLARALRAQGRVQEASVAMDAARAIAGETEDSALAAAVAEESKLDANQNETGESCLAT